MAVASFEYINLSMKMFIIPPGSHNNETKHAYWRLQQQQLMKAGIMKINLRMMSDNLYDVAETQ